MCRLALLNKKGFEEIEKKYGVIKFFNFLEKANGGQGNGFILVKNKEIVCYEKGVKLSNKKIVAKALSIDFDWILYHTRIVSKGNVCEEQCHPFVSPKKDYALAMNGTESHFGEIGKLLGTSDTDALFRIYHAFGINNETLKTLDSRFMGFKNGKMFFTNPSSYYSSLEKMKSKSKSIVVASCFPNDIESEKIECGFYWEEGKKIKTNTVKYTKYTGVNKYYNEEYYRYETSHNTKKVAMFECMFCGEIHQYNGHLSNNKWEIGKCEKCGGELDRIVVEGQTAQDYLDAIVD